MERQHSGVDDTSARQWDGRGTATGKGQRANQRGDVPGEASSAAGRRSVDDGAGMSQHSNSPYEPTRRPGGGPWPTPLRRPDGHAALECEPAPTARSEERAMRACHAFPYEYNVLPGAGKAVRVSATRAACWSAPLTPRRRTAGWREMRATRAQKTAPGRDLTRLSPSPSIRPARSSVAWRGHSLVPLPPTRRWSSTTSPPRRGHNAAGRGPHSCTYKGNVRAKLPTRWSTRTHNGRNAPDAPATATPATVKGSVCGSSLPDVALERTFADSSTLPSQPRALAATAQWRQARVLACSSANRGA